MGGQSSSGSTTLYYLKPSIDFEGKDYVTTEIACQIWARTDITYNVPNEGATPKVNIKFKLKVLDSHGLHIEDTIRENGCLAVKYPENGVNYIRQKSEDGINWTDVDEKKYDLTIVNHQGQSVNVAMDLDGRQYYRVKKSGTDFSPLDSNGLQTTYSSTFMYGSDVKTLNSVNSYADITDLGDVEVQGFQMSTNIGEGGASENNPSFRVVCRVSNNTYGALEEDMTFRAYDIMEEGSVELGKHIYTTNRVYRKDSVE